MIHIKSLFDSVEAKIIKAKDAKATLCDKNNFCFIKFEGKDVKLEGDDELSIYLFNKAIKEGANGEEIKPKAKK